MSPTVVSASWLPAAVATAEGGEGGFQTPGVANFWWPVVPFDGTGPWVLTRPALVLLISVGLLAWFYLGATRKLSVVPTKSQFLVEGSYNFVRNTIGRDIIGSKDFLQFVPLLMTLFTLILVNNVFGIVPFIQFPTMSRLGIPLVLTVIVYITYHTVAIRRKHGVLPYFKSLVPPGLPGWLKPILFALEFLTYFVIRPLTLALRLFGNMLAGHLMLLVFILGGEYLLLYGDNLFLNASGVLSFVFSIAMTFFELLIEFLQAFIFTLLAALYISDAVSEHH
ncbi:F0F1 ATP synthase subunit A [Phycicoccus jejuensis]|uniref:F0F1 ATP synthase subunit A n=1 Tax=Phycicoccus jejuensis TaxID=367299 RepID=UPI00384D484F